MKTRIHHIALGARDVERVALFYADFFRLDEVKRFDSDQGLRSIWLDCGAAILMIEKSDKDRGHVDGVDAGLFLISFAVDEEERSDLESRLEDGGHPIEDRTAFTSYTRDPEGNRVAFSLPVDSLLSSS